ncbi:hypothetical protein FSP39_017161 [Pinctada imbricata]|uniref:Uncharacterized protein n=1 Tax=Pinctada imbricata TaxID=66713 RepID=A0AA89C1N2_PINIB|nr:hypothetical protein FSP39_017161 [Pinctada imbricata]
MASIRSNQKAGLGSSLGGEQSLDNANITSKYQRKLQAQARFQKVSKESDNNQADSDSSYVLGTRRNSDFLNSENESHEDIWEGSRLSGSCVMD